jgi:hypothetical protein
MPDSIDSSFLGRKGVSTQFRTGHALEISLVFEHSQNKAFRKSKGW